MAIFDEAENMNESRADWAEGALDHFRGRKSPMPSDNTKYIIMIAQENNSETLKIEDDAEVQQEQGGCYVAAWVWVENVYIVEDE